MGFRPITPLVRVDDLDAAVARFVARLGFAVPYRAGASDAYVEREGRGVRLLRSSGVDGAPPGNRRRAW